jgi:hypothetical protein
MKRPQLCLFCLNAALLAPSCVSSDALISSEEVSLAKVESGSTHVLFEEAEAMASRPVVLAGERATNLTLNLLNAFKHLGDSGSEKALMSATESQRSAVRLFIEPDYFERNFTKTRSLIEKIPIDPSWPAVKAEKTAYALPVE